MITAIYVFALLATLVAGVVFGFMVGSDAADSTARRLIAAMQDSARDGRMDRAELIAILQAAKRNRATWSAP